MTQPMRKACVPTQQLLQRYSATRKLHLSLGFMGEFIILS